MDNHVTMLGHPGILIGFGILVFTMLLLDLGVFNKKSHIVGNKEASLWTLTWIALSMAFAGVVYLVFEKDSHELAVTKVTQYLSAYWIEKALSVDNLFVFILVFDFFNVAKELHHKVLFWGIIGALAFRAIFIFAGVELINVTYLPVFEALGRELRVNVVLTVFGIFLVVAGIKSAFAQEEDGASKDFGQSPGARLVHKFFKVRDNFEGDKFFTVKNGVRMATPLFVVLAIIEFTDLIFAVDSIPAIFAIAPDDPFILYTSNIMAILGLRSLYFLLANFIHMFRLLKYGLAAILAFIGVKMVISPLVHISSPVSLAVVGSVLLVAVLASVLVSPKNKVL
ncbi:MAG: TerC/Alx family metal homeostasis membrane protein [Edaphocola sp.]